MATKKPGSHWLDGLMEAPLCRVSMVLNLLDVGGRLPQRSDRTHYQTPFGHPAAKIGFLNKSVGSKTLQLASRTQQGAASEY